MKSKFNIHESEGRRDGLTGDGFLLSIKFTILKNQRELYKNSPIMAVYEENYQTYKEAFLQAFWSRNEKQI